MTTDSTEPTHRDIEFHETPERTLSLDVYEPTDRTAVGTEGGGGPRPTIVSFHGGGFHSGDRAQQPAQARALADEGYVVVRPEYRLSGEATFPAALVDAKAAVEWCRAEGEAYGIDPRQIAAAGHSAGANLATLVSVTPNEPGFEPEAYPGVSSAVGAAVGWAGLYDCRAFDEDPQIVVDYLGGTREEVPTAYDFASPLGQTDAGTPPTLVVHGEDDEVVPFEQARRYAEAVEGHATGEFVPLEDCGHVFHDGAVERQIEETDRFLSAQLDRAAQPLGIDRDRRSGGGLGGPPDPERDRGEPPGGDRFGR